MDENFLCETKLKKEDPKLHQLFTNSVFALQGMLTKYKNIFPMYTDHSTLHSMEVLDFCNKLISEQISMLNADEIYILLMSCYLHDAGMGVSSSDYEEFSANLDFGDKHYDTLEDKIRSFHNELSGEYIKKYAEFLEIPSQEHVFAIVQVSRGHRKTDLFDEKEYPTELKMPSGNTVALPYLAALIRLADELDIGINRNLQFMYDIKDIKNEISNMEYRKHEAVKEVRVEQDKFVAIVMTEDEEVWAALLEMHKKLDQTLQECRNVVKERTNFVIAQDHVEMIRMENL